MEGDREPRTSFDTDEDITGKADPRVDQHRTAQGDELVRQILGGGEEGGHRHQRRSANKTSSSSSSKDQELAHKLHLEEQRLLDARRRMERADADLAAAISADPRGHAAASSSSPRRGDKPRVVEYFWIATQEIDGEEEVEEAAAAEPSGFMALFGSAKKKKVKKKKKKRPTYKTAIVHEESFLSPAVLRAGRPGEFHELL